MNLFTSRPSKTDEFQKALQMYGDLAYRMALQLTGGKEDEARDLVQEAFIKIWNHWGTQRPEAFKGWMYRILHNLYMDAMRKRSRQGETSLDAGGDDELTWEQKLADEAPTPAQQSECQDLQAAVRLALGGLEPEYRVAVTLCDMEGMPYDEIARVTGSPIGTVRSRIHRGRQQLRRALRSLAPERPAPDEDPVFPGTLDHFKEAL